MSTFPDISGQWFGTFTSSDVDGKEAGPVIVNLDRRPGGFSGTAYALERRAEIPAGAFNITLLAQEGSTDLLGHARLVGYIEKVKNVVIPRASMSDDEFKKLFPDVNEARDVKLAGHVRDATLSVRFETDAPTSGTITAQRKPVGTTTLVDITEMDWQKFRSLMTAKHARGKIYRGQSDPRPLRTAFHRAGRFDTARFGIEDALRIESAVSGVTNWVPPNNNTRTFSALLGIAQHHGYLSPLLDWTRSPYVAAYFACKDVLTQQTPDPVIFEFEQEAWTRTHALITNTSAALPGFAFVEAPPLFNPRAIPQQSVLMFCNMDNIEREAIDRGNANDCSYVRAYRLSVPPRIALRELRLMGVYAGSLFPGLDGACRGAYEDSLEND